MSQNVKCWIFPLSAANGFFTDCEDTSGWDSYIESNNRWSLIPSQDTLPIDGRTFLKTLTERYPGVVARIQHGDFLVFAKDGEICGNWDEDPGMMLQMYRGIGGPTLLGFEMRDGANSTIHRVFVSWTERYPNPLHFILDTDGQEILGENVETGQPVSVKNSFSLWSFVSLDIRDCKVISHQIGIFNSKRCTGKCMGLESTMPDGYHPSGPPYSIIHTSDGVEYIYSEGGSWEIAAYIGPVHIYTLEKFGKRITLLFPSFDRKRQNYDEYLGKDPLKENPIVSAALLTDSEFPGLCFTINGETESRGKAQIGLNPFYNWFLELQGHLEGSLLENHMDDIYNSHNITLLTEDQLYLATLSPIDLSLNLRKLRNEAVVAVRKALGLDSSLTAAAKLSRVKTELDRRFPLSDDPDASHAHKLRILYQPGGTLGEAIGRLTGLRHLDLHRRQLASLPESFGQLTGLAALRLDNNRLTHLPELLGRLTRLSKLSLDNNRLTSLPESLGKLTGLTELSLEYNQLTSLLESLGRLTGLTKLSLEYNQLTSLPESFGQLTYLKYLRLNNNQLTGLPESLGKLIGLYVLPLNDNQLASLPKSLSKLTGLTYLSLGNNKLANLLGNGDYSNNSQVKEFLKHYFAKPVVKHDGVEWTEDWDCGSSGVSEDWLRAVTGNSQTDDRQELCSKLQESVEGGLTCDLCGDSLLDGREFGALACGHLFHWEELEEYAGDSSDCPNCSDLFKFATDPPPRGFDQSEDEDDL